MSILYWAVISTSAIVGWEIGKVYAARWSWKRKWSKSTDSGWCISWGNHPGPILRWQNPGWSEDDGQGWLYITRQEAVEAADRIIETMWQEDVCLLVDEVY